MRCGRVVGFCCNLEAASQVFGKLLHDLQFIQFNIKRVVKVLMHIGLYESNQLQEQDAALYTNKKNETSHLLPGHASIILQQ